MNIDMMKTVFLRLVAFPKTNQIGCDHAVACRQKYRNHLAVKIAPARTTVQAKKRQCRYPSMLALLVQIMHAQASQCRQVADVVRRPWIVRQAIEGRIGRAQRDVLQRMIEPRFFAAHSAPFAKKCLQQGRAFCCHDAALNGGMVVDARFGKQVQHRTGSSGFGLCRSKHHPLEPRLQHRATAHGAGLERHIQLAVIQPVIA